MLIMLPRLSAQMGSETAQADLDVERRRSGYQLLNSSITALLRTTRINDPVELVDDSILDVLMVHINVSGAELARGDALLEEDVELGKGAAAGFWQAEEGVDDAEEADNSPEESGIVLPVPLVGVEHVRGYDTSDDGDNEAVHC